MNNFKEHIDQIQIKLNELMASMQPWLDVSALKDKRSQLISIEKTIDKLQKNKTPIPDELRELKFKLIREIDVFKDAREAQLLIISKLQPFLLSVKQKVRKSRINKTVIKKKTGSLKSRVEVLDLLKLNLLSPDTSIEKKYKGHLYKALILSDGQIQISLNGKTELHNTPSSAAVAASGKSQNGWTWWNISNDPEGRTLDYFRKKYLKYETQTGR
jgi:hypothetical protein